MWVLIVYGLDIQWYKGQFVSFMVYQQFVNISGSKIQGYTGSLGCVDGLWFIYHKDTQGSVFMVYGLTIKDTQGSVFMVYALTNKGYTR